MNSPKPSNAPWNIFNAAIACSGLICSLLIVQGIVSVRYFPSSNFLNLDVLPWKLIIGIASYFSAAGLVYFASNYLRARTAAWIAVAAVGSAILVLFAFSYDYLRSGIEIRNCEKRTGSLDFCSLSTGQFIYSGLAAFIFSIVITSVLLFITFKIFQFLPTRSQLK